jgi:hypothetical protein
MTAAAGSPFEQVRRASIPSLAIDLSEHRHRATGARHFHFATEDGNNGFVVAFLTVPQDSTGVAHVLEHTSLCGSETYPIRDPFFMMIRRSLATFMNAFTSSDWTAYPFATQNERDFDNLLSVYLDAVFFPRLDPLDFAQEGHRLEPADPADPRSELVVRGVVYNEMKGVMSQPTNRLYQELMSRLFPTTTYHHNHGGDPAVIPQLTHDDLVTFHARHYHPSNAVFMTWGDMDPGRHQRRMEELALSRFDRLDVDLSVPDERRYDECLRAQTTYPVGPDEPTSERTHVVLGWLLGRTTDPFETLETQLVADVLLAHGASPLRRALETTDLGSSPSGLAGLQTSTRESAFVCGLEGSEPQRAAAVEELVMGVLEEVAAEGVDPAQVEAALHQLELSQREIGGGDVPYGLQVMLETLPAILHGGDPVGFLDIDPVLDELRRRVRSPGYVRGRVRALIVDNPHRVRLTMAPDPGRARREEEEERERIAELARGLDDAGRADLARRAKMLARRQSQQESPDVLPRVHVSDIPADVPIPEGRTSPVNGIESTWFEAGTNGLVYVQVAVEIPDLPAELVDVLGLYASCLTEVGSGERTYLETQAQQAAVTGGVGARARVRGRRRDVRELSSFFSVGTKALARNVEPAVRLLMETFTDPRFDEHARLREIVSRLRMARERNLLAQGHALAMKAATASIAPQAALSHRLAGLASVGRLRELDRTLAGGSAAEGFSNALAGLGRALEGAPRRLLLVGERPHHDVLRDACAALWKQPYPPRDDRLDVAHEPSPLRQAWTTATTVSFCAAAYPCVAPSHPDAPALTLLGPLLRNGFLHNAVRERGGAYGAGAGYDADSGAFRFFSYRDPRIGGTLADFRASVEWAVGGELEERLLEEAVLNVVGRLDRPDPPAGEAIGTYYMSLHGRTPEVRRRFRASLLDVTLDDVRRAAETWLVPGRESVAVLTGEELLSREDGLDLDTIPV